MKPTPLTFATYSIGAWAALQACSARLEPPPPSAAAAPVVLTSSSPAAPAAQPLQLGAQVPQLPVVLQDGFKLDLRALKGKLIVLYFCPAVADQACVREAEGLRDSYHALHDEHHVAMVGISREDPATHRAFIAQHALPFDIAADPGAELARAYGVPERGNYAPRVFLFARDNTLRAAWNTADPEAHVRAILAAAE
jgi:peroxiredoxin Q/BCP